ncbi:SDR family NAD(P)-dependent oxidoreductase [Streptomyces litchfieldiae]|uniref:SDR family NAD(P)-dependent oxidoreductase n=1 Tax=Streptomyces litchfieldiae TaxID=3075543 RepID=A0ABU2MW60_9ACTN|nr:SDR family NAD(P)-dependent oxidoreductase [Streptomyces sp. DSM 44938]MDT0345825.1 SDR family NAD(P)-dependent oxidoreductase [Streptomyces sp. DSM 44938]
MRLTDTVALVTGGTAGLGLATARLLLNSGAKVVITGRTEATGKAAAEELGPGAAFVAGDVADEEDIERALNVAAELGSLRTVVCCAGVPHTKRMSGSRAMSLADFCAVIQTNLIGTFNTVRLAAARIIDQPLVEEDRGVIVTTSSIAAWDGQSGQAAYASSKAAVAGMTLPLARELAEYQIRVVNVAPGLFDTELFAAVPERVRHLLVERIPHPPRMGVADEFASFVGHVIGNGMLNGESIRLDGALRMQHVTRDRASAPTRQGSD